MLIALAVVRGRWQDVGMKDHPTQPWLAYPDMEEAARIEAARSFYERIQTRRSCRHIGSAPVDRNIIESAILAAGTAPSGANHQPWHFAVIETPAIKQQVRVEAEKEERAFYTEKASAEWITSLAPLGTDADKPYLEHAPYLIVIFGQRKGGIAPGDAHQNYYVTESVGIATGLLLTSLHLAGLATLTHTPNPMRFLNQLCRRPADEKPIMIVVVGHAKPDATIPVHATLKKSLDQITSWF
jgi:iodotyrosine deiodinase